MSISSFLRLELNCRITRNYTFVHGKTTASNCYSSTQLQVAIVTKIVLREQWYRMIYYPYYLIKQKKCQIAKYGRKKNRDALDYGRLKRIWNCELKELYINFHWFFTVHNARWLKLSLFAEYFSQVRKETYIKYISIATKIFSLLKLTLIYISTTYNLYNYTRFEARSWRFRFLTRCSLTVLSYMTSN